MDPEIASALDIFIGRTLTSALHNNADFQEAVRLNQVARELPVRPIWHPLYNHLQDTYPNRNFITETRLHPDRKMVVKVIWLDDDGYYEADEDEYE